MKATENQIDVCEALKECLATWQDSNDITSPSHFNLIECIVLTEMMDYEDEELKDMLCFIHLEMSLKQGGWNGMVK